MDPLAMPHNPRAHIISGKKIATKDRTSSNGRNSIHVHSVLSNAPKELFINIIISSYIEKNNQLTHSRLNNHRVAPHSISEKIIH